MDDKVMENIYQEKLEERLVEFIAENKGIDYKVVMDIYYRSKLVEKIHEGKHGVQYLDHKVLAQILEETEPELFRAV